MYGDYPPPLTNQRLNTLTFLHLRGGWGAVQRIFEGGTPQTKWGSAGKRPTLVDAKNAFIRLN